MDRKFGVSRRFSQTDKREIAALMAVELEMIMNECKHETELVQAELNETSAPHHDLEHPGARRSWYRLS